MVKEGGIKTISLECASIANHHQHLLGPSDSDIQPPVLFQEAKALPWVASHGGEDDDLLLPALEAVHGVHLDTRVAARQLLPGATGD